MPFIIAHPREMFSGELVALVGYEGDAFTFKPLDGALPMLFETIGEARSLVNERFVTRRAFDVIEVDRQLDERGRTRRARLIGPPERVHGTRIRPPDETE